MSLRLDDVLNDPPKPHKALDGGFIVLSLRREALQFIHDHADRTSTTLETGCGLSTVVFAMTGARHWSISPATHEADIVVRYCRERQVPTEQLTFIAGTSEHVLPALQTPGLDLVLIDGRHGFPAPYIDWFYTAGRLKRGGYLIVDDVWLWSVQILHDFLEAQPEWQLVADFGRRTSVFKKLGEGSELLEWTEQPLVARSGRMKWINGKTHFHDPRANPSALRRAFDLLRRGEIRALSEKARRKIRTRLGG